MNQPGSPLDPDSARRLQVGRRVKRGVVAGYIHELSARHGARNTRGKPRAEALGRPSDAG
jgi:hypothetical protein